MSAIVEMLKVKGHQMRFGGLLAIARIYPLGRKDRPGP
jgi:hypothetical protein